VYQFPFYPENIPEELKAGRFWVCCDGAKVPEIAGVEPPRRASSTNPRTWHTFAAAVAAYERGLHAGVGRVIAPEDSYVGIDLDGVRDPATRRLEPRAARVLDAVGSYSEVSPSGRGVKVWVRARLDRSYVRAGLEVYARGRYFVMTGQILPQYPAEIADRQEEIEALLEREFPRPGRGSSAVTGGPYDGPEITLVEYLDGVEVLGEIPDGLGKKHAIVCPWVAEHSGGDVSGTYIGQREGGGLWFHCNHAHCGGRTWKDFRARLDAAPTNVIRVTRRAYASPKKERRVNIHRG
jgi:hypothetical protein